jgi:holo-[acyl-carrier protein] synthase
MAGCLVGAGIDLVENERMRRTLEEWGPKFRDRVFLPAEQAYCESKAFPISHYAGRFAVKEALTKAFGTGIGPEIGWRDIEVTRDGRSGAPSVALSEKGQALADRLGVNDILVSLSHTENYAIAHALLLRSCGAVEASP